MMSLFQLDQVSMKLSSIFNDLFKKLYVFFEQHQIYKALKTNCRLGCSTYTPDHFLIDDLLKRPVAETDEPFYSYSIAMNTQE